MTLSKGAAFDALVAKASLEGRKLTDKERLQNPDLQKDMEREKSQTLASAEAKFEQAKAHLKAAELALKMAREENK